MATQTVEFIASTGQTITAKLFAPGSDTIVASAAATEGTNRKGTYSVDFTDVPSGLYRISAFNPSVIPLAHYWVDLLLVTDTYQTYEVPLSVLTSGVASIITPLLPAALDAGGRIKAILDTTERDDIADRTEAAILNEGDSTALMQALADKIEQALVNEGDTTATILAISTAVNAAVVAGTVGVSVAAIQERTDNLPDSPAAVGSIMTLIGSGTGARTITITVNDGTTVLENAVVRMTEGVNTYTALTNASGIAVFNLDDATYTVAISKSAYTYSGTTLAVSADASQTYSMTAVSITPGTGDFTTGYLTAYDETGTPEVGVSVYCEMTKSPTSEYGYSYDSTLRTLTSVTAGLVEIPGLVKGGTYRIWRGSRPATASNLILIPTTSGSTYALPSHIGRE